jgi:predicted metal-dependent hydrolase
VAAPEHTDEDTIRLAVVQRLQWIRRQREQFQKVDRQTKRKMESGETHYVWGQRYRLDVSGTSSHHEVQTKGNTLWVIAPADADADARRATLDRWYRRQIKAALPAVLKKWQPIVGAEADKVVVRRMKTKWGTCVTHSRTICINLELAKKNPRCLEYIVVHELTHLHERGHGERFVALMDRYLPDWRARRDELNAAPLADEAW